ncbi:MAG: hypothetical protein DMG78_06350, partial [Acidobacteria bacterium]
TARICWKLLRNAPDTMSSTNAIAISDTTNPDRNHVWLDAPVPVRVTSFKLSVKFVRNAAKAGARLQRAPV